MQALYVMLLRLSSDAPPRTRWRTALRFVQRLLRTAQGWVTTWSRWSVHSADSEAMGLRAQRRRTCQCIPTQSLSFQRPSGRQTPGTTHVTALPAHLRLTAARTRAAGLDRRPLAALSLIALVHIPLAVDPSPQTRHASRNHLAVSAGFRFWSTDCRMQAYDQGRGRVVAHG